MNPSLISPKGRRYHPDGDEPPITPPKEGNTIRKEMNK